VLDKEWQETVSLLPAASRRQSDTASALMAALTAKICHLGLKLRKI